MKAKAAPAWTENAVVYEIYPQTFYDSNGDGIGDLPGIIAKLNYVQSLGVDAIWLNPFYASPMQDAGYDVADFYSVHPRYGNLDDARRLFSEAHARGLRVLIDFVPGHTAAEHPWFQASIEGREPFKDWYVWTHSAWADGGEAWRAKMVHGMTPRNGNYFCNFFAHQPALNYGFAQPDQEWQLPVDHPNVQKLWAEMKNVQRFWLDLGADGFRIDMAGSIIRQDAGHKAIRRFWRECREEIWEADGREDVFTVAEWSYPKAALSGDGLHADFLHWIPSYQTLFRAPEGKAFFHRNGQGDISAFLKDYLDHYEATRGRGHICIPLGNHDLSRINDGRLEPRELELVQAFLLSMPGVPFLYYGDEIGMRQLPDVVPTREGCYPPRSGARTPMQWSAEPNAGFSTAPATQLWSPVDSASNAPNVAAQEKDSASLLQRIRQLIAVRRREPALRASAAFTPVFAEPNTYPLIFARGEGADMALVLFNPADCAVEGGCALPAELADRAVGQRICGAGAVTLRIAEGRLHWRAEGVSYTIVNLNRKEAYL